jgi:hypothetical protein
MEFLLQHFENLALKKGKLCVYNVFKFPSLVQNLQMLAGGTYFHVHSYPPWQIFDNSCLSQCMKILKKGFKYLLNALTYLDLLILIFSPLLEVLKIAIKALQFIEQLLSFQDTSRSFQQ